MPPRPLSHSSINLYVECPQKWKFKYVDKLPEKPKHFFSFGKSVHSALEYFYNVAALPAPTLEQVLAEYKAKWLKEGYKDSEQEAEYFADGEKIIKGFYAKHIETFVPPFFAEYRFDIQVDGIPVTGFVDRIDKVGDDRIAIIDYKTGKKFPNDRVKTDGQLTMYQMACEELLGRKVDSLTFYHLPSQKPITTEAHPQELIRELRGRVVAVAGAIQKEMFEPKPSERVCMWCDYKPFCPIYKGQFNPGFSPMPEFKPVQADGEIGVLIDRYGQLQEQIASLQAEAEDVSKTISDTLQDKGWVRAFGSDFEIELATEEKWEFDSKARTQLLDIIRKSGRWEDILAPSAPLVQKLMDNTSLPPDLRERLHKLGQKNKRCTVKAQRLASASLV